MELLLQVPKAPGLSPRVLAFSLRLAGLLAAQEDCFQFLQVSLSSGCVAAECAPSPRQVPKAGVAVTPPSLRSGLSCKGFAWGRGQPTA